MNCFLVLTKPVRGGMKHDPGLEGAPRGSCRQGTSQLGLGREGGCLREPVREGLASRSVMETMTGALSLVDSPPGRKAHKWFGRTQSNQCFFSREGFVSNSGGRLCASILSLPLESLRGSRAPRAADALVPGAHSERLAEAAAPTRRGEADSVSFLFPPILKLGEFRFSAAWGWRERRAVGSVSFLLPPAPWFRGVSFLRGLGLAGAKGGAHRPLKAGGW